jgi:hypothetical protein
MTVMALKNPGITFHVVDVNAVRIDASGLQLRVISRLITLR